VSGTSNLAAHGAFTLRAAITKLEMLKPRWRVKLYAHMIHVRQSRIAPLGDVLRLAAIGLDRCVVFDG
jgi:hypothetical protein